jgi:hypothetical protein
MIASISFICSPLWIGTYRATSAKLESRKPVIALASAMPHSTLSEELDVQVQPLKT